MAVEVEALTCAIADGPTRLSKEQVLMLTDQSTSRHRSDGGYTFMSRGLRAAIMRGSTKVMSPLI